MLKAKSAGTRLSLFPPLRRLYTALLTWRRHSLEATATLLLAAVY